MASFIRAIAEAAFLADLGNYAEGTHKGNLTIVSYASPQQFPDECRSLQLSKSKHFAAIKRETPSLMPSGSPYIWVRTVYSAAGTTRAALAALAALFFARRTFAQRFC